MELCKILIKQFGILAFLWFTLWLKPISSQCNVCMGNNAACINTTSYNLCFDNGQPFTDLIHHCPRGLNCTSHPSICVRPDVIPSSCGVCVVDKLFVCPNLTTYLMCYNNANPSGEITRCPTDHVCDENSNQICVPVNGTTGELELDNQEFNATETCSSNGAGLYSMNDPSCKQYLSCTNTSGNIRTCTDGTYFNSELLMCQFNKPPNCN